jgi:PIN domain nuclease of toxin-antitoxin system
VRLLLDTHILIWSVHDSSHLSANAKNLITDLDNELFFSAASLWEIAIKTSLGRGNFQVDLKRLRSALLQTGYDEIQVLGSHSFALSGLPPIHKDPFDRMLVAQAISEGVTLLTADPTVASYPGPIRKV